MGSPSGEVQQQEAFEWIISFSRDGDGKLGIDFNPLANGWKVTAVSNDGLIGKFNTQNPEAAIQVGDYITHINGESAAPDVMANAAMGQLIKLQVKGHREKAPPQEQMSA